MQPWTLWCGLGGALLSILTQPPANPQGPGGTVESSVARLMAFDADKDGKVTRAELADPRLQSLFDRADTDRDGSVTQAELTTAFTREAAFQSGEQGPVGGGNRQPGGPPGPPRPGQVLPLFLQEALRLTPEQRAQVEQLQKEVDARLNQILTAEQREQLSRPLPPGPGSPGGPPPPPADGPPRGPPRPR